MYVNGNRFGVCVCVEVVDISQMHLVMAGGIFVFVPFLDCGRVDFHYP